MPWIGVLVFACVSPGARREYADGAVAPLAFLNLFIFESSRLLGPGRGWIMGNMRVARSGTGQ